MLHGFFPGSHYTFRDLFRMVIAIEIGWHSRLLE